MNSLPMPAHVIQKQRVTRQFHPDKFIQPSDFSNIRTLKVWNNLGNDIIETTPLNAFKHGVSEIDFDLLGMTLAVCQ